MFEFKVLYYLFKVLLLITYGSINVGILGGLGCNWDERYCFLQLFSLVSFINYFELCLRKEKCKIPNCVVE